MTRFRISIAVDLFGTLERVVEAESATDALLWGMSTALQPPALSRSANLDPWIVGTDIKVRIDEFGPVERPKNLDPGPEWKLHA